MRFLASMLIAICVAVAATPLGAAAAPKRSYSGNWPLIVTHSQRFDGRYCLTLTDDGSRVWPHSGAASLSNNLPYGTFQIIDRVLIATIQQPAFDQNAGLVFTSPITNGNPGKGVFEQVYGGVEFDSGVVEVGRKGGC